MKSKGFTLIELLVVVAIIGILATVVLASLNSAGGRARDAVRKSDLRTISLALETFFHQKGMLDSDDKGGYDKENSKFIYIYKKPTKEKGTLEKVFPFYF